MTKSPPINCQIYLSVNDRVVPSNRGSNEAGYLWVSSETSTWLIGYQHDYRVWALMRFLYQAQPWTIQKRRFQQLTGEAYYQVLEQLKSNGVDLLKLCNTTLN